MSSSIVLIEIENGDITNIDGTNTTIMVVDYDAGDTHKYNGRSCVRTLIDCTTRKVNSEQTNNKSINFTFQET